MSAILFPYTELQGTVGMKISAVTLDGKTMPWQTTDADELVIELRNVDEHSWETGAITIEVTGPAAELQARAGDVANVRVVAALNCGPTNHRIAAELAHTGADATWSGTLELDRPDWYGLATLTAVIVATVEGVDKRQAGIAPVWTIRFDDLPPREISNSMRIQWEDFSEPKVDARTFLLEYADDLCYLRLDADEPVLYLNESFTGLRALLDEKPGRPEAHRILRTQVLTDIASHAWHAMFMAALEAVEVDEDDKPGPPPEQWQRNVLDQLLPRLYPNIAVEEALGDAWTARRDPAAASSLQERLLPALSQHVHQPKALRAALNKIVTTDQQENNQ